MCECESVSLCVSGGECIGAGAPTWGPWVALRVRPTISGAWRQGQDRAPEATGNRTAATEREKLPQPFCSQTASCPRPHPLVRLPSCGSSCPAPTPTPSAARNPLLALEPLCGAARPLHQPPATVCSDLPLQDRTTLSGTELTVPPAPLSTLLGPQGVCPPHTGLLPQLDTQTDSRMVGSEHAGKECVAGGGLLQGLLEMGGV